MADAAVAERPAGPPRILITTCMKNEGPFILDWLAHHRALGIAEFLVFTNHCTDGTDRLLSRLDARGLVRHVINPVERMEGYVPPLLTAIELTKQLLPSLAPDYVISMDVDEYINIHAGAGLMADLFAALPEFDVLSISEVNFGWNGHRTFAPDPVVERFTVSDGHKPRPRFRRRGVKSIQRVGADLTLKNHRPLADPATAAQLRWFDGSGAPVPPEFIISEDNGYDCRGRYDLVQLNHYATRDLESFLVKSDRGDAVSPDRHVGRRYWRVRNIVAGEDLSIQRYAPRVSAERKKLLDDPETARLHAACIAAHQAKISELKTREDLHVLWALEDKSS